MCNMLFLAHLIIACSGCFVAQMGLTEARAIYSEESPSSIREEQCHDGCIKKFATDDISCLQAPECSTCWDDCSTATTVNRAVPATWPLFVSSMIRDGSLVAATVAWRSQPLATATDCLVTWEVAGGGLIGNLLTQTSSVELSLWPETKYRVQVTCKIKDTEEISRSVPLTLDTTSALVIVRVPTITPPPPATNSASISASGSPADSPDSHFIATYRRVEEEQPLSEEYQNAVRHLDDSSFDILVRQMLSGQQNVMLGVCLVAIFMLFMAIVACAMVISVSCRQPRLAKGKPDKVPLVEDEQKVHVDADRLTIHV